VKKLLILGAAGAVFYVGSHHGGIIPATSASGAAGTAVAYAQQQVGKPYLWGGTGPSAFDCSGLVMAAYRSAGVSVPHTSQDQWATEPHVPAGQERPGDAVFFAGSDGTRSAPGHEGIVIGPHRMIEAYRTGVPVRVSTFGLPSSPPGDEDPVGFTRPAASGRAA
jgi:cell wall-associated NlpC family hydrolase